MTAELNQGSLPPSLLPNANANANAKKNHHTKNTMTNNETLPLIQQHRESKDKKKQNNKS